MKKTVEQVNREQGVFWTAVECPLCASTETTRMNGKPIGKIAAEEMAKGKAFFFCGTCGAGFFALPPVEISDEAIMIGNMVTLWLEIRHNESRAYELIDFWEGPRQKEADIQRGRFSGSGWDALIIQESVEAVIGECAALEIACGISHIDPTVFDGTKQGDVV